MSVSKECHDTEQHQNANPVARVRPWIAAGLAFFVVAATLVACSNGNHPTAARTVSPKAMSAVFYQKADDALPMIPKPPHVTASPIQPEPPMIPPPPPPVAPVKPVSPVKPVVPTWTPPPRRPAPPKPPQRSTYTPPAISMPRDAIQEYARSLVGSSYEFTCLAHIVERESGWNPHAINQSGAYGVPQALPGAKMSSAGADWRTNPKTQLRWMVGYLHSRYGSACNAWSFWQSHGWY